MAKKSFGLVLAAAIMELLPYHQRWIQLAKASEGNTTAPPVAAPPVETEPEMRTFNGMNATPYEFPSFLSIRSVHSLLGPDIAGAA